MKHSPEPWATRAAEVSGPLDVPLAFCGSNSTHGPEGSYVISFEEAHANAKRIVGCVNACAGIENPGETIRELVEACEAFEALHGDADMRPEDECWEISALCRKALAKAKGGAE